MENRLEIDTFTELIENDMAEMYIMGYPGGLEAILAHAINQRFVLNPHLFEEVWRDNESILSPYWNSREGRPGDIGSDDLMREGLFEYMLTHIDVASIVEAGSSGGITTYTVEVGDESLHVIKAKRGRHTV